MRERHLILLITFIALILLLSTSSSLTPVSTRVRKLRVARFRTPVSAASPRAASGGSADPRCHYEIFAPQLQELAPHHPCQLAPAQERQNYRNGEVGPENRPTRGKGSGEGHPQWYVWQR